MFKFNLGEAKWFFEPKEYRIEDDKVEIITEPHTDFWQRTYYNFRNDNAHVFYNSTEEKYFSFTVKAEFQSKNLFDQCGIVIYQDSENWVKAGVEYHDNEIAWLGSVVTNNGYSDWATSDIQKATQTMWYRLNRRESDYCLENSFDGIHFHQMRIFHLFKGDDVINFGLLACSPSDSSFKATFSNIEITECLWKEHK